MVTVQKTNTPATTAITAKVQPADMLRRVIQLGKAARTAALDLCYAATAYILLVNHFTDAKTKGYMTRTDALDFLRKQLRAEAGIEGGMLDIYIRNASSLAGALSSSPTVCGDVLKSLATAAQPEDMITPLSAWMDKNHGNRALRGKIDSLATLSEALGFSTGRKTTSGALTAEKVPDRINATMKAVEKIVNDGDKSGDKVTAATVMKAVVAAVPSNQSLTLAKEAISRVYDTDALDILEAAIKTQRKRAKELSAAAETNAKKAAPKTAAKVNKTGRSTTARTSV